MKADAIFTAANQGKAVEALELCFQDADGDLEEQRFCCFLADRLGVSPEDPKLPENLRERLAICPVVLPRP
ncbi:MAG: hypothetical protein NZ769_11780 [Anaerolineae bacterium]|nr:hypothetical protein [Anaerolineae bacterium]MCX8068728.1 hypothetical protein [Anaerolineae bacterium]